MMMPIANMSPCDTDVSMVGTQKKIGVQKLKNAVERSAAAFSITRIPAIMESMNPHNALGAEGCAKAGPNGAMNGPGGGAAIGGGPYAGIGPGICCGGGAVIGTTPA